MDLTITNIHIDTVRHHFFNSGKYCLPGQGNVCHHTKKFTKGLDPFIKYLVRPFFADFDCCEDLYCLNSGINDSRDCSHFLIGHLCSIHGSLGKNFKRKQCSFYTFFYTDSKSKYQEKLSEGS